ncbi:Poly(A) ribonuclease pop2 [Linum perenne]
MGFYVREVWNNNLSEEFFAMEGLLAKYPIVSLDAEFPGFLRSTPWSASEEVVFQDLKYNTGSTTLIQLGLALSNSKGTVGGIWEFNFQFDLRRDIHTRDSVEFLAEHGIDFEKLRTCGVDRIRFGTMLRKVISTRQSTITWVTFHGVYDLAYILKAVCFRPIPDSSEEFVHSLGMGFDAVVDVKYMAKFNAETGSEIGLQKLADSLWVKRRGEAHTAGSDSLLTALVYFKLKKKLKQQGIDEHFYVDFIYGISSRISSFRNKGSLATAAADTPQSLTNYSSLYHHNHDEPTMVYHPNSYHHQQYQQQVNIHPNMMMGYCYNWPSGAPATLVQSLIY